jgi:hypothetical protein
VSLWQSVASLGNPKYAWHNHCDLLGFEGFRPLRLFANRRGIDVDCGFKEEAESLQMQILTAISQLEQIGQAVLEDDVLCRDISAIRRAAGQVFMDISREGDSAAVGELLQAISDVVSALQDRVIEALGGSAGSLIRPVSPVPPSRWLH